MGYKLNKLLISIKYFSYGLQFTAIILSPIFVLLFVGGYIQKKYNLDNWVILLGVFATIVIIILNLYSFGKMILKEISKNSRSEHIGKQNNKK